jgi:hypothetical protein
MECVMPTNVSSSNKEALIDKYRYINVECNGWWETVFDLFKQDMAAIGIHVENIYFSGFELQGEGACFEGYVEDWEKFLYSAGYTDPVLIDHANNYWDFRAEHSERYYHVYTVNFFYHLPMPWNRDEKNYFIRAYSPYEDEFRNRAWFQIFVQYLSHDFPEEFTETFRSHMRDLYRRLKAEYNYLISDEAVWEAIVANGMEKEEVK